MDAIETPACVVHVAKAPSLEKLINDWRDVAQYGIYCSRYRRQHHDYVTEYLPYFGLRFEQAEAIATRLQAKAMAKEGSDGTTFGRTHFIPWLHTPSPSPIGGYGSRKYAQPVDEAFSSS